MAQTGLPIGSNLSPMPIARPDVAQTVTTVGSAGASDPFTHTVIRCTPTDDVFFKIGKVGTTAAITDNFMIGGIIYPEIPVNEGEIIAFATAVGDTTVYISELI